MNPIRTLFLTKHLPYPPLGGAAIRNWQNISLLSRLGPVATFSIDTDSERSDNLPSEIISEITTADTIALNDLDAQRSWRDRLFRKLWQLRRYGHPLADRYFTFAHQVRLQQMLETFCPDLVVFEEPWTHQYLPIVQRYGCRTVYDAHNIESCLGKAVYEANGSAAPSCGVTSSGAISSTAQSKADWHAIQKLAEIERRLIEQCDQTWVCSAEEIPLLRRLTSAAVSPAIIPNGIEVDSYDLGVAEREPYTIIFTATFLHPPNAIAAEQLITQIYPRLKQRYPDCQLWLVGRFPTDLMQQAASCDRNIIVTGAVADVRPYLARASAMVVPLYQGGGTRLKILEAFAAGCPVVSTEKGAEGLAYQRDEHLLVANTADELAAAIEHLWRDRPLVRHLVQSAHRLVADEYSWKATLPKIKEAVGKLAPLSSQTQPINQPKQLEGAI